MDCSMNGSKGRSFPRLRIHVENCLRCQEHLEESDSRSRLEIDSAQSSPATRVRARRSRARSTVQLEGDLTVDVIGIAEIEELRR